MRGRERDLLRIIRRGGRREGIRMIKVLFGGYFVVKDNPGDIISLSIVPEDSKGRAGFVKS